MKNKCSICFLQRVASALISHSRGTQTWNLWQCQPEYQCSWNLHAFHFVFSDETWCLGVSFVTCWVIRFFLWHLSVIFSWYRKSSSTSALTKKIPRLQWAFSVVFQWDASNLAFFFLSGVFLLMLFSLWKEKYFLGAFSFLTVAVSSAQKKSISSE